MTAIALALFLSDPSNWNERQWSEHIAAEWGKKVDPTIVTEHRLPDDSRVDILTLRYAVEVEWADKWQQSIGQALLYAELTDRKPKVILLMRGDAKRYYLRAVIVCKRAGIAIETRKVP